MDRTGVQTALEAVKAARSAWGTAQAKFNSDVEYVMTRLVMEAAVNYMSAEDVAKHSGMTVKRVRIFMRRHGLNPTHGKRLLSKVAAHTLESNAALLGVDPSEIDLMSPLAYLPAGSNLKSMINDANAARVTEFPETCPTCGRGE